MEQYRLYDKIICIDLKCFFASVECVKRGKDPEKHDLVVADTSRGKSSIVLAISPSLKNKGIANRCRIFDLPSNLNVEFAKPKMANYIEASNSILNMYLQYFSRDDILVYSIDEVFIDATSYLPLYKMNIYQLTKHLLAEIKKRFGLTACAGIGNNLLLAKLALDIEAKKNKDLIATWGYNDLENKLWPITDLTKVWGIGAGLKKKLNNMNINSMYDLAHYDIYKLVSNLGVIGEELYLHANGIDVSKIQQQEKITVRKGYNINHTLYKNTPKKQTRQLIKELALQLSQRLISDNKTTSCIHLYVGYGTKESQPSFKMQHKLEKPMIRYDDIVDIILILFDNNIIDIPIRRIGLAFTKLADFQGVQLSLFETKHQVSNVNIDFAYDKINSKYGNNTMFKASALTSESQYFARSKLIGGHNAK